MASSMPSEWSVENGSAHRVTFRVKAVRTSRNGPRRQLGSPARLRPRQQGCRHDGLALNHRRGPCKQEAWARGRRQCCSHTEASRPAEAARGCIDLAWLSSSGCFQSLPVRSARKTRRHSTPCLWPARQHLQPALTTASRRAHSSARPYGHRAAGDQHARWPAKPCGPAAPAALNRRLDAACSDGAGDAVGHGRQGGRRSRAAPASPTACAARAASAAIERRGSCTESCATPIRSPPPPCVGATSRQRARRASQRVAGRTRAAGRPCLASGPPSCRAGAENARASR